MSAPRCRLCGSPESPQLPLEPAYSREYEGGAVWAYECVRKKQCASRYRLILIEAEKREKAKR